MGGEVLRERRTTLWAPNFNYMQGVKKSLWESGQW